MISVINGGDRLNREYGLGRKRADLFIAWPVDPEQGMYGPLQRVVIELKIQRGGVETLIKNSLEQVVDYQQQVGAEEAHLVIFNRKKGVSWKKKIWQKNATHQGQTIAVWGGLKKISGNKNIPMSAPVTDTRRTADAHRVHSLMASRSQAVAGLLWLATVVEGDHGTDF